MTETIMFNFDTEVRRSWIKALKSSRQEFSGTVYDWYIHLDDAYGIKPVMLESGIAGIDIVDPDKAVLFKLRWM